MQIIVLNHQENKILIYTIPDHHKHKDFDVQSFLIDRNLPIDVCNSMVVDDNIVNIKEE